MLNLLTSIRSSSRQPGERLPGEYRNFSSRDDIPLLCTVLCGGLSGKNTFSLLSVFKRRRNFVCNWSPPVPLGGPEIVRLWGTGTRRGLFGGSAGGSVCCGLRIPSTAKQRTALRLAKLHVAKYAQNMSPQKIIKIFVARFSYCERRFADLCCSCHETQTLILQISNCGLWHHYVSIHNEHLSRLVRNHLSAYGRTYIYPVRDTRPSSRAAP